MNNYIFGENIGLLTTKAHKDEHFNHVMVTKSLSEAIFLSPRTGSNAMNLPLYRIDGNGNKFSNLNENIVSKLTTIVGKCDPQEIFDYLYAILHSPTYRLRYSEFFKTDFPRIPYPTCRNMFDLLSKYGKELRELHLMESSSLLNVSLPFPESGSDKVESIIFKDQKIFINETQYFGNVSEIAWNFFIGGYQPAQKWLKDRKGKLLNNEDIEHYQKIIFVLENTDRIMKEIDGLFKDWPIK
jgi:predicted helicase